MQLTIDMLVDIKILVIKIQKYLKICSAFVPLEYIILFPSLCVPLAYFNMFLCFNIPRLRLSLTCSFVYLIFLSTKCSSVSL